MEGQFDISVVDWSRAQFALTAMYHYLFVPLTLGLSFIIAIMETLWVKTNNPEWKQATKFWMTLFGINFAIGVSTGIILEFEFGTNWSNYSWFVGDIFGAPLAVEGIMAFFMESTFIAIMYFGWNKVSKKYHLISTWLVFVGANLSALWILVANAWMQNPVGMVFNPDTARNEMADFWEVLFSPTAMSKFFHTVSSAYLLSSIFVIGVSSWYLLKKRHISMAYKSVFIACLFGLFSTALVVFTGDTSAQNVAKTQPMKFAAMEGLYEGDNGVGLIVAGVLSDREEHENLKECKYKIEIPNFLSFLAYRDFNAFIPGVKNILDGYTSHEGEEYLPVEERIAKGKLAIQALKEYSTHKKNSNKEGMQVAHAKLVENYKHFGYGYMSSKYDVIPPIPLVFYSFHIMVGLGFMFLAIFILFLFFHKKQNIEKQRWLLLLAIVSIPLAHVASQCGWIVAEVGRQPWVIRDLMPTLTAVTKIDNSSVIVTFCLFAVVFTGLLVAEIMIMTKQIRKGPKE